MTTDTADRGRCWLALLALAAACLGVAQPVPAEELAAGKETHSPREWFAHRARLWQDFWEDGKWRVNVRQPEWLVHRSGPATAEAGVAAGDGSVCLVVQEDRLDGPDLLTARYTLLDRGHWRAFAGAGVNQAQYFHDARGDLGPTLLLRRNRSTSLGAAAEVGAELELAPGVLLNADLRWAQLHDRAEALRSDYGPVAPDPVAAGVSIGYRFR